MGNYGEWKPRVERPVHDGQPEARVFVTLLRRVVGTSTAASLSFGMTVLFGLFAVASIAACANAVLG
jgi:hypothetical protein